MISSTKRVIFRRRQDESLKVSTPVLSPAHSYGGGGGGGSGGDSGSLQTRESTSEPFTPVYSRVTTPTLELSPDAKIPISPGSPMIFNSQDQDFILQNFGIQRVALDLEVADEVDKVLEGAESFVRTCRLTWGKRATIENGSEQSKIVFGDECYSTSCEQIRIAKTTRRRHTKR